MLNLTKYLRTFLHKNSVLTIGITDQSDYSICYVMVRLFIHTVNEHTTNSTTERQRPRFIHTKSKKT